MLIRTSGSLSRDLVAGGYSITIAPWANTGGVLGTRQVYMSGDFDWNITSPVPIYSLF